MLSEISASITILEKLGRWLKSFKKQPEQKPIPTIASRFIQIFEAHAIHRNQIPRFFGHGLTIADVQSDETLIIKLTEEMLADVCKLFAIRREWLDGADEQIYPLHNFYKWPEKFEAFLKTLGPIENYRIEGELLVVKNKSKDMHDDTLLILEEIIGELDETQIYRYHICDNWVITYWKARVYMAACIAVALRNNLHVNGRYIPEEYFKKYHEGLKFFEYELGKKWGAMPPPRSSAPWYPDALLQNPEFFLDGIDEEYGLEQGLRFWLDLEKDGQMKCGKDAKPAREHFEQMLHQVRVGSYKK